MGDSTGRAAAGGATSGGPAGDGGGSGSDSGWPEPRRLRVAIAGGLLLVALGAALSGWATTDGGEIEVRETSLETDSGLELTATVYEPPSASDDDRAPAVTLIHGYTGTRETMRPLATELADRGYVAVAVDQPGHGDADPPAFADGFGGPAALEHTRSLETVDPDRVALAGHSMGGFAALEAAAARPNGYESLVLLGSTWGPAAGVDGLPEANETFPRNLAVLFSPYDEYSTAMWNESIPGTVGEGKKLAAAFGTDPPVEPGRIYGSLEDGTARRFTAPASTHTGARDSPAAIADAVEWIDLTVGDAAPADADRADGGRWQVASHGHTAAFAGGLVVAIATTALAWRRLEARVERSGRSTAGGDRDGGFPRSTLLALSVLPAATIYPLYAVGSAAVPVTRLTHQDLTHGYVLWALGTVALAAALVRRRHGGVDRASLERLVPDRSVVGRSVGAAGAGFLALYALVALVDAVPGGGVGAALGGFEPLSTTRWLSLAVYVAPFTVAAVAFGAGLERALGARSSLPRALGRGLAVTCGGLTVFLAAQYAPLYLGYGLPVPELGPLAITATAATGTLAAATIVSVAVARLTDAALPAGVLTGLLVAWQFVATGPIPVAPF